MPRFVELISVSVASLKTAPAKATRRTVEVIGHLRRALSRWKSLLDGAGGLRRVGKVFSGAMECYGVLEKTFLARWRPLTRWRSLFRRAGGLRRVGKVFFEALEAASGLEKSFSRRWRTNWAWKSGLCLRFYVASLLLACGWVVGAGAFRETPDRVAGVESSSPQLLLTLLADWGQSKTPDSSHTSQKNHSPSPRKAGARGQGGCQESCLVIRSAAHGRHGVCERLAAGGDASGALPRRCGGRGVAVVGGGRERGAEAVP